MSIGPSEVVVILLVLFLLFGSRRLADLGKGIGDGIRGFKRGIAGEQEDEAAKEKEKAPEPPRQLTGRVATPVELGAPTNSTTSSDAGVASPTGAVSDVSPAEAPTGSLPKSSSESVAVETPSAPK